MRRKAEKEKLWENEGDIDTYDIDKVLKELGDDVKNVNIGKKAGKKPQSGDNSSGIKDKNKSDDMGDQKTRKKKKKKKNHNRHGVGESERVEAESKDDGAGVVATLTTNSESSTFDAEYVASSNSMLTGINDTFLSPKSNHTADDLEKKMAPDSGTGFNQPQQQDQKTKEQNFSQSEAGLDLGTESQSCEESLAHTVGPITIYPGRKLGQGGFGIVCEGKFGGRRVAIKRVLLANVDREAQLHMKCDSHENVLRYIHTEEDKITGLTYLVLELCQGTLVDYVEGRLNVKRKQPKDLLKDATRGVVHLHNLGIVHRDVKPSNILISLPESGVVKAVIGDFGVSKELNDGHQSFSVSITGTQRWMAPEILFGDSRATIAVDVYALGLVFFYVLTNRLPFDGKSSFELMTSIKNGEKSLCQSINNETAKFLIGSMTSHDAKHRPQMEAVLEHPFFWENSKELRFIEQVSDHLPGAPKVYAILKHSKEAILGSSTADWGEIASKWPGFAPVINHLRNPHQTVQTVAKYDFSSVAALMRAIRNLCHHLNELPKDIQALFGGSAPKTLVSDKFLIIFPQLLVGTWSLVSKEIGHEPGFQEFYHEWWVKNASNLQCFKQVQRF